MPDHKAIEYNIAEFIEKICEKGTLVAYANDDSGNMSLDCYRSQFEAMQWDAPHDTHYWDTGWDAACEIIRDRYAD